MDRDEFFHMLPPQLRAEDLQKIQHAYWLAKHAHRDQVRDTGERYFEHPRRVAISLIKHGFGHEADIIVDGFLHDVPEDTVTPNSVIVTLFGKQTWNDLRVLSKKIPTFDPVSGEVIGRTSKTTEEYYDGIANAEHRVRIVKCDDRLDNVSDMKKFTPERRRRYIDETRRYIIPIARQTSLQYLAELERACDAAELAFLPPPRA
jgi:GTP pyrophosphokinase